MTSMTTNQSELREQMALAMWAGLKYYPERRVWELTDDNITTVMNKAIGFVTSHEQALIKRIRETGPKTEDIPFEFRSPSENAEIAPRMARNVAITEWRKHLADIEEEIGK